MVNLKLRILCGFAMIVLGGYGYGEELTRQGAAELMQECHSERERNLAPLKEKEIEDCINKRGRDREYCERYFKNYGTGTQRQMGWGIPICEKARNADKYFKMYPAKKVYAVP